MTAPTKVAPVPNTAPAKANPIDAMFLPVEVGMGAFGAELDQLIVENQRSTQAIDLALNIPVDLFAARHPGVDPGALLDDAEFSRRVELLAATPVIQKMAADMQARRNIALALTILGEKLADPDCSVAAAKDMADISMRQAGQMGQAPKYERTVAYEMGVLSVVTVLGRGSFLADGGDSKAIALGAIRAARCISAGEIAAVLDVMRSPFSRVSLAGW